MSQSVEMAPSRSANKWLTTLTVVCGSFMAALDQTVVNIAIPHLQKTFAADIGGVQWVITAYLLTMGAVTPLSAFLANRVGVKRSYMGSLALFMLGSLLCDCSWDLTSLSVFRVLQALGGASLMPLALTIVMRAFPANQRGTAMASFGLPTLLAPALGPVLGGYLVTYANWSLIFLINIPIGVVGLLLAWFFLRESRNTVKGSFDIPGFVTSAYGLAAIIYAVSETSSEGWGSTRVIGFLTSGVVALTLFVLVELATIRRGGLPLLDIRLFRHRSFAAGMFAVIVGSVALFGPLLTMPIYLQNLLGQTPFEAGLTMLSQAATSLLFTVIGGRLVDRIGPQRVAVTGFVLLAINTWLFSYLSLDTPLLQLSLLLALRGMALGLALQPLVVAVLADIHTPQETADASTMVTVIRNVAASAGVAAGPPGLRASISIDEPWTARAGTSRTLRELGGSAANTGSA